MHNKTFHCVDQGWREKNQRQDAGWPEGELWNRFFWKLKVSPWSLGYLKTENKVPYPPWVFWMTVWDKNHTSTYYNYCTFQKQPKKGLCVKREFIKLFDNFFLKTVSLFELNDSTDFMQYVNSFYHISSNLTLNNIVQNIFYIDLKICFN